MTTPADLLNDVEAFVRRYVVLTSAQSCALALWVAHAHVIVASECTPYLAVTSPERRSGKTRLLEVLELLVPRPLRAANLSEAALFRTIAEERVTLLLDEADAVFNARGEREDLRGLVNAGYRRGAVVLRCEVQGKRVTTQRYDAFGAKVIAAIGQLPETISDRSIPIRLQRKHRGETVERFRLRCARPEGEALRDRLAAWADDPVLLDVLEQARPGLPDELDDRAQDGWEPLLAIADLAGGHWPELARAAAVDLHTDQMDAESVGTLLLRHLRAVFNDAGDPDDLTSARVLERLVEIEQGPWAAWWANDVEMGRTRGPASKLARLLKPYGIESRMIGPRDSRHRGYRRADLEPAWARYTSTSPVYVPENVHTHNPRSDPLFDTQDETPNTPADQGVDMCTSLGSYTERWTFTTTRGPRRPGRDRPGVRRHDILGLRRLAHGPGLRRRAALAPL